MAEALKRPDDFVMAFNIHVTGGGDAAIKATFKREHIPFLLRALAIADDILAFDDEPRTETAQHQPPASDSNVNETGADAG